MTTELIVDEVCEYVPAAADFEFASPFARLVARYPQASLEAIVDGALTHASIESADRDDLEAWFRQFEAIRAAYLVQTGKWLHYQQLHGKAVLGEAKLPLRRDVERV